MKIAAYAVKNWQLTLILFLMIVLVGVNTLLTKPRAEDPEINPPEFPVVVIYPGTSPSDMEELVVKPLEQKIAELEDLKRITTNIDDGVALLDVEFDYNTKVSDKYQELVREVNSLRSELPADLQSIEVRKVTPTDVNVMQMALISENASMKELQRQAETLTEKLEKIKSLKKVRYNGVQEQEVRIALNLAKLAQLKIPVSLIIGSIQSEGLNIPGGSVVAGDKVFNVKSSGKYSSVEEIANTVVYNANGSIVLLKDVASVSLRYEDPKHIVRVNGYRAVLVNAAQKAGENIEQTKKAFQPVIDSFATTLPANISLVKTFDQADNVNRRLGGLGIDFIIAISLVLITLLPLGTRAALVVMISIPLSLALGLVALNFMGYSLNQLSIVGLVVALGLLVDDSIVVVENIERWLREGYSKRQAAIEATKQIGLAVVGCTATLMVAFMPLVFLPEASGEFIRSLPLAVISSVFASMLVSLTIVPFLSSRILKAGHNPEGNFFMRTLKKGIKGSYSKWLDAALKHPVITFITAALLFAASLMLFPVIGFKLFPTSEKPQFLVNVNTPLQSNLEATDRMVKQVEAELATVPEIKFYTSNTGKGNPRIYYNEIQTNEKSDYAQIFVQLHEEIGPEEKKDLIEKLRMRFLKIPGAKIEVKDFEQGPPVDAPVAFRISGDNLDTLRMLAGRVKNMLDSIPGTIYTNNEIDQLKSDIRIDVDREKARTLGILTADIDRTIRLAVSGLNVGVYTDNETDNDYNLLLTTPRQGLSTLETIENLFVNNAAGTPIPLNLVASARFETSPVVIHHMDKKRFAAVTSFVRKGALASRILAEFEKRAESIQWPPGYDIQAAGEAESQQEAFGGGFSTIIIITVFLFITILVLEFKTIKSTLIVLSVIPLGIIGGVMLLWATGNPLSFVAIIGFIGLAGIEVKNSILLVDFTNQLRREGKSLDEAIREAGEIRFVPIVLTSLTAIGGLIPIALNNNPLISPLALVLIGGLISSTLLSRVVTPVVYKLIPPSIEKD
jgi:multidrug efflux pump subunit AcrB